MRELKPGTNVRIEHNARIVGLADEKNKYWYQVVYPSGETDVVSLARINAVVDTSRAVIDTDCSIQIFSPRLSPAGALDLLLWLETHRAEFETITQDSGYAPNGSNYHDHLCSCPGCDPQPPDGN